MNYTELFEKIHACWLGRCIGYAHAMQNEETNDPGQIYPLDLALLALHAAESYGTRLTSEQIADEWAEHCFIPRDEYGHAVTALRMGFRPPYSGLYDNHFLDCIGGLARAQLWGSIAAGNPRLAAELAHRDALVDHPGGEGMYGEIFLSALTAGAYDLSEVPALIRDALTFVPQSSRTHRAVSRLLELYEQGMDPNTACLEVSGQFGLSHAMDTPQNLAAILAGLLWGRDGADAILQTQTLGGDPTCTASACGAVWGILYGKDSFPQSWVSSVETEIFVSEAIRGFRMPADLQELTRRCMVMYGQFDSVDTDDDLPTSGSNEDLAVQHYTIPEGAKPSEAFCVDIRYEDNDPSVSQEHPQSLRITLTNNTTCHWTIEARMECPYGLTPDVPAQILVSPGESVLYTPMVKADTQAYFSIPVDRVYPAVLAIKRLNCGDRWKIYRLPVPLLVPNRWLLNGVPTLVPASTVRFRTPAADGVYVAEATLCTPPVTRETRMICNCSWPITVELDGDVILQTEGNTADLPSYDLVPAEQHRDGILQRGFHKVRVTVRVPDDARELLPSFFLSFNAPEQVIEPGSFYAYTDVHFAR